MTVMQATWDMVSEHIQFLLGAKKDKGVTEIHAFAYEVFGDDVDPYEVINEFTDAGYNVVSGDQRYIKVEI